MKMTISGGLLTIVALFGLLTVLLLPLDERLITATLGGVIRSGPLPGSLAIVAHRGVWLVLSLAGLSGLGKVLGRHVWRDQAGTENGAGSLRPLPGAKTVRFVLPKNVVMCLVREFGWLASATALALMASHIIHMLWFRDRPFVSLGFEPLLAHVRDSSFPSDHVLVGSVATVFALERSRLSGILCAMIIAAIAFARVASGLHWYSDTTAGVAVACSSVLALEYGARRLASTVVQER